MIILKLHCSDKRKAGVRLMKLYIKAKRFSWRDQLIVRDEQDELLYKIKSERISIGNKVHIVDHNEAEILSIEEKRIVFSPKYTIYQQGEKIASVKKESNLFASDYEIDNVNWKIKGNVDEEDYEIKAGFSEIASFKKKWFSYGDSYVLDVKEKQDAPLALGIITAIWCLQIDEQKEN